MESATPVLAIRLGLKEVQGLGPAAKDVFERERSRAAFRSLPDFIARTGFDRETLERLAEVGALLSLTSSPPLPLWERGAGGEGPPIDRRATLWATGELAGFGEQHLPGLAEQVAEDASLAPMDEWEEVQADYRGIGFSVGRHVVSYFRPRLDGWRAVPAAQLPAKPRGLVVCAGGLVICRQRPETAADLVFMTLEDETGLLNAIVHPHVYERLRRVLRGEPLLVIEGPLQKQDGVAHILVRRAWPLAGREPVPRVPSHDFH